jgi:hypothetical protein
MMINEKWEDANGRKHRLYTVRSAGRGFFMIIDVLRNVCMFANGDTMFTNRADAWQYLREN